MSGIMRVAAYHAACHKVPHFWPTVCHTHVQSPLQFPWCCGEAVQNQILSNTVDPLSTRWKSAGNKVTTLSLTAGEWPHNLCSKKQITCSIYDSTNSWRDNVFSRNDVSKEEKNKIINRYSMYFFACYMLQSITSSKPISEAVVYDNCNMRW
jgi:hypothetical protein